MMARSRVAAAVLLTAATIWIPPCARAALGDTAVIPPESAAPQSTGIGAAPYTTRSDARGAMQVREYLDASGKVFAVSWSGPTLPDLRALLGQHYSSYLSQLASVPRRSLGGSLRLASKELVIELHRQIRGSSGLAYLPACVPAGVAPDRLS